MLKTNKITTQEFSQIIAQTKLPVMAAVRRYLGRQNLHAIDDVIQEVYIRTYKALVKNKLKDYSKLRSYLYTIAKNESLRINEKLQKEVIKRNKFIQGFRQNLTMLNNKEIIDFKKFQLNVIDAKDREEKKEQILQVLKTLPKHYSNVVELKLEGATNKEIMEKLDIKEGTIKSRMSRALLILKQNLKVF